MPVRRVGSSTSQPGWGEYYATVENTSNAWLARYNEGLDRIGVRYGYRF